MRFEFNANHFLSLLPHKHKSQLNKNGKMNVSETQRQSIEYSEFYFRLGFSPSRPVSLEWWQKNSDREPKKDGKIHSMARNDCIGIAVASHFDISESIFGDYFIVRWTHFYGFQRKQSHKLLPFILILMSLFICLEFLTRAHEQNKNHKSNKIYMKKKAIQNKTTEKTLTKNQATNNVFFSVWSLVHWPAHSRSALMKKEREWARKHILINIILNNKLSMWFFFLPFFAFFSIIIPRASFDRSFHSFFVIFIFTSLLLSFSSVSAESCFAVSLVFFFQRIENMWHSFEEDVLSLFIVFMWCLAMTKLTQKIA